MADIIPVKFGNKPSGYDPEAEPVEIERNTDTSQEDIDRTLRHLDEIRELVAAGRIVDFVFIGQDRTTGLFLNEMHLNPPSVSDLFAYSGLLSTLQLEVNEMAQAAPMIRANGQVIDPWFEHDMLEDFDDD